ncbi:hypothetical protein AGABI1DRAFT_130054 [Agaricus bisporus var. burnettii JB137-S8]|uniref:EthD domain-containing protein n=1 Tax=Agaricus bisporus var. burnettii (strain JB137-S8 / ATCC MYA-4627 / FGSC 10392) TaxID=597362 RepID=K5VTI5_AGABU|nr:uncharacterized protein AGABI1DRAFT_130054 [Agaricus bisporus var. burnettii JB137-S8]EKM77779.1 hypothetical protein AGABI1DRAFT_130054 [Agaricus bisporus var. burnettii JB137-S8]
MAKGFLAVLSEPGQVTLDEFQDWYNNEHVPLRLNHLPSFLTGARYSAVDGKKPGWIALYDIDSTTTFSDPSYTRLRQNRSPREASLVKRLDILDRRTCEVMFEVKDLNLIAETGNTGLAVGNPTRWILSYSLEIMVDGADGGEDIILASWQKLLRAASQGKGVLRSRLFKCIDGLKTGVAVSPDSQKIPGYFVLHELTSENDFKECCAALDGLEHEKTLVISEMREWQLYRAYPAIAQGNVS